MKKALSILLSILLVLSTTAFALTAAAEEPTYAAGDHIQFGTYPQTRVDETPALAAAAAAATWKSYGYYSGTGTFADGLMQPGDWMQFADFFCGGEKYRAVYFTQYRPGETSSCWETSASYVAKQKRNGYYTETVYYFRYEPLMWRVLDPSTGQILCDTIIDCQAYSNVLYRDDLSPDANGVPIFMFYQGIDSTNRGNLYETSSIRAWLHNDFYKTAFTDALQANIKTTEIPNGSSIFQDGSTLDKVFLPSFTELNTAGLTRNEKKAMATDYTKCQGISFWAYSIYADWWIRDPEYHAVSYVASGGNHCIGDNGEQDVGSFASEVNGVRPMCCLYNLINDASQDEFLYSAGAIVHTPGETVIENNVPATCTEAGGYDEVVYCTQCPAEISRSHVTVPAPGHNWGEWEVVKQATVDETGLMRRTCANDPTHVEEQVIPKLQPQTNAFQQFVERIKSFFEGITDWFSRLFRW